MTARHFIVGMALWLGLLYFGARWAARPFLWVYGSRIGPPLTMDWVRKNFSIRLAALPDAAAEKRPPAVRHEDDELDPDESVVEDWAVREFRNRGLFVFVVWMACGFLIHWVISRIIRGEVDLT